MSRRRGTGIVGTALLALLCGGLVVAIFLEFEPPLADPGARAAARREQKAADPAASEPRFVMPPMRDFGEVLARPVFSETRRPPPPEAATAPASSAPFALVGVVVSAGDRHVLLEHGQPPRIDRAAEGQELDGWTLETVELDRVVLRRGDSRVELKAKGRAPPASQARRAGPGASPPPSRGVQVPALPSGGPIPLSAPFGEAAQQ